MEQKIRLGIIGLGNMGTTHARNILAGMCPDITLAAIAELDPQRITWGQENLGCSIRYFSDAVRMLDSGLVDACLVCTPHFSHPEYAIAAMQRGLHVMVEKPAGVYTRQVKKMNEEADRHPELVFGMMFNQRTNWVYRRLRQLVQSGKYGAIRRTNWLITNWYRSQAYYDSGSWRATWAGEGGGGLLNQCPHQLDLWQWICGMPAKVHCHMHFGKWHDIEVEDEVTAYVEYPNGATGVFVTTTGDGFGSNRLEIQMDKAKLVVENEQLRVWEFAMTEQEFSKTNTAPFGSVPVREIEVEAGCENPQHVGVLNAWAGRILRGSELVADGREGIRGLTLSNAMHLSAFTGQTVTLPLDDELYFAELEKRIKASRHKAPARSVFADTAGSYSGT